MKTYSLPTKLFLCSSFLVSVANCGGDTSASNGATIQGRISDGSGSQAQSLRIQINKFGGSGSIASAATVRVSQLAADGSLMKVGQGMVLSGRYTVSVPPSLQRLVVDSLDASGNVVASAIVEASGAIGTTVTVTPIDTESSVEAAVMAKMAASGVALDDINVVELRERITSNVATAVQAATDADNKIKALADAIAAAQVAKIKGYGSQGVTATQAALFNTELAAAQKLNTALDTAAGVQASVAEAYATFHSDLTASVMALDASVKKHARAEANASVAFRSVIKARLSAAGDAVADAAQRSAASGEARIAAAVVESILTAGTAASDVAAQAKAADAALIIQLSSAANAAAAATAFASWNVAFNGGGTVTGSVLGKYLGVNVGTAVMVQGAVTAANSAAVVLDSTLHTVGAALSVTGAIDFNTLAQNIITAYTTYQTSIDQQAAALSSFGTKAQTTLDVLATATGSFRVQ